MKFIDLCLDLRTVFEPFDRCSTHADGKVTLWASWKVQPEFKLTFGRSSSWPYSNMPQWAQGFPVTFEPFIVYRGRRKTGPWMNYAENSETRRWNDDYRALFDCGVVCSPGELLNANQMGISRAKCKMLLCAWSGMNFESEAPFYCKLRIERKTKTVAKPPLFSRRFIIIWSMGLSRRASKLKVGFSFLVSKRDSPFVLLFQPRGALLPPGLNMVHSRVV